MVSTIALPAIADAYRAFRAEHPEPGL